MEPNNNYLLDCSKLKVEEFEFSKGSFSKVYKGYYNREPICVKVIKKDNIDPELFVFINREIDILKELYEISNHNIIKFIGVGEKDKLLFLVTELINGGDLGSILRNPSIHMPWNLKYHIAKEIAQGMKFLHSKNIMHRDLKSNNLLVGKNWNIKICDFGFAKTVNPHALTMTICGTDEWMSPEVILGMPYSHESDVYSYGMVLIELITQCPLEERLPQNNFDVDVDHLSSMVPPDCPDKFWKLALQCSNYYPKERPTFDQIVETLESLSEEWVKEYQLENISDNFPESPFVISNPNFIDDENSLDHWHLLSNLPDDCLEEDKRILITPKVNTEETITTTTTNTSPVVNTEQPKGKRWFCSIM